MDLAAVSVLLERLAVGSVVVVGASGGPDSAGLLLAVSGVRSDLSIVAVHVRHGLRDDSVDAEVAGQQAVTIGASFRVVSVEVVPDGEGVEAAARDARHEALQSVAASVGASAVLLGHTRDDQAETVLLRLARGTSLRGAGGMRAWRPHLGGVPVGRPLLSLARQAVHKAVAEAGLPVVHDPTNTSDAFARNVVRGEVLPALERHAGDPVRALARFADRAAEDDDHLRSLALEVIAASASVVEGVWTIHPGAVYDQPPAIARRVVAELLTRIRPGVGVVAAEVDDVLALAVDRQVDRRGVTVTRHGRTLRFELAG